MNKNTFSPKRKDRKKIIRGILQEITLIVLLIIIVKALFPFSNYEPYSSAIVSDDKENGFITVSYFGVDRNENDTLISTSRLEEHLKALKENGYVTITQQDILDYYLMGKKLPQKSLFLLFEDGRRDTAIFSQRIMEKQNLKGTILTYADKFERQDPKFLRPKDLSKLLKSSYWELGTNGYRLEYINVFDRNLNYLGTLSSLEFSKLSHTIDRNYNHYLMDYIRDENDIPLEDYVEMEARIDYDYEELEKIYNKEIGEIPKVYVLMHSNTGKFGTNDKVSEVNSKWIKELFAMNFNREGNALNTSESSIYDLTRIQPQSYWSTNHLLMRIKDDTKGDMVFVSGDEKKAKSFKEVQGKAEFKEDVITLTSLPSQAGTLKLLDSDAYKDIVIDVELNGNVIGCQGIYLRSNEDRSNSVCIKLINNVVNVIDNINGSEETIFSLELNEDTEIPIDIKDRGNRTLNIRLIDNKITVSIDGEVIVGDLVVNTLQEGSIYLESAWGEYGYSQRNLADDVYDGVFKKLKITDVNGNILFDTSLKGIESIKVNIKEYYNNVLNWFIKHL